MNLADDQTFVDAITAYAKDEDPFLRSTWFYGQHLDVYMRNGFRWINGEKVRALTASNVTSKSPGNGLYSQFLLFLESLADVVYVENVLYPDQYAIYLRRGYTAIPASDFDPLLSFYKVVDHSSK